MKTNYQKIKRNVWQRDNFTCYYCGIDMKNLYELWIAGGIKRKKALITVDHIIPLSKGGTWDMSNLKTSCYNCNQQKSSRVYSSPKATPKKGKRFMYTILGFLVKCGESAKRWQARNSSYDWQDKK